MGLFRSSPFHVSRAGVSRLALAVALAAALGGCAANRPEITGSVPASNTQLTDNEWRQQTDSLAAQYRARPNDPEVAIAYARALRASDQRAQAAAVLQQASIRNPNNSAVLGAYGRALADTGRFNEALDILGKAHTPDQPDWRILNAQGAVLDQLGRNAEARRYYETALKIVPNEPSVLSNLGLSYALSKDLERAEATLRRAAAEPRSEPKVRQNLGVVLALRSKFEEAERVTMGVLPAEQARSNVAYFRELMRDASRPKNTGAQKTASAG
ncbi:MAG: tetratricopeptide repeat protein [Xanthobacteraceae bacterium]